MEHYAPHTSAAFEGYYSRFLLPSGASLALIVCTVPRAQKRPHMISFTYVPSGAGRIYQRELWVESLEMKRIGPGNAFELQVPGLGFVRCAADSSTEYDIKHDDFSIAAHTSSQVPWSQSKNTPEGFLVYLPLPLHWHVQSLASLSTFELRIRDFEHFSPEDSQGKAVVHQEKNWARSFPRAHVWIQVCDDDRSLCLAGGEILGLKAFLIGYRNGSMSIDFGPPFAVSALGLSPFMSVTVDWERRRFRLSVQSFRQKVVISAYAPEGTFFSLSGPFPEGHRENFMAESFRASVVVEVYESGWLGPWRVVRVDRFEGAALEFGGDYYPFAGSTHRYH